MEEVQNIVSNGEKVLNRALDNIYISTAIKVFIGLYAGFAAPKLPPTLVNLMDNIFVRIMVAFVIVLTATRDPSIAILIAVAFIITLQTANKNRLINTSLSVSEPGESSWLPSAKSEAEPDEDNIIDNTLDAVQNVLTPDEKQDEEDEQMMKQSMPSENIKEPVIEPMASEPAAEEPNNSFTSKYQFLSAQDNSVPGANQMSSVSTFSNQHSIQGLNLNAPDGM